MGRALRDIGKVFAPSLWGRRGEAKSPNIFQTFADCALAQTTDADALNLGVAC